MARIGWDTWDLETSVDAMAVVAVGALARRLPDALIRLTRLDSSRD